MDERERLIEIMNSQGVTAKQFSLELGISAGTLSNIIGGRNKPSLELLKSIAAHYPSIQSDWLFLGKGEMYTSDSITTEFTLKPIIKTIELMKDNIIKKVIKSLVKKVLYKNGVTGI